MTKSGNHDQNPFDDPLYDPFAPPIKRVEADGSSYIDILGTAQESMESQQPELRSDQLRPDDELAITLSDDTEFTYKIRGLKINSMAFGGNGVRSPHIIAKDESTGQEVLVVGSSIFQNGNMSTPGVIAVGSHLNKIDESDSFVSDSTIATFSLKRRQPDGQLEDVRLNEAHEQHPSESFSANLAQYTALRQTIEKEGFDFADEGKFGLGAEYFKVEGNIGLFAARQGFGSALVPQDEIYVFDAAAKTLHAMRHLPTKGILQTARFQNVTPHDFAEATFAYSGEQLDWKVFKRISGPRLHQLSYRTPFVTYTWLKPSQAAPIITVKFGGELAGQKLRQDDPDQTQEGLAVELAYANYEMDIQHEGGKLATEPKANDYWVQDPSALLKLEQDATRLSIEGDDLRFEFGDVSFVTPLDPVREAEAMVGRAEAAIMGIQKFAGKNAVQFRLKPGSNKP